MGKEIKNTKLSEHMKLAYASGARVHPMKGKKFSDASRRKMSISHTGQPAPTKGMKMPKRSGENHWNWKGGKSTYKHHLRSMLEWKQWRTAVFERDGYQCQECGVLGAYLEPHHILPIRTNDEAVFDTNNGITLCRPCHQKTIWKEADYQEKYSAIVMQLNNDGLLL